MNNTNIVVTNPIPNAIIKNLKLTQLQQVLPIKQAEATYLTESEASDIEEGTQGRKNKTIAKAAEVAAIQAQIGALTPPTN